jgi:hypothetical protein
LLDLLVTIAVAAVIDAPFSRSGRSLSQHIALSRKKREKKIIRSFEKKKRKKNNTYRNNNGSDGTHMKSALFSHDCNEIPQRKRFVDANESTKRFLGRNSAEEALCTKR